MKIRSALYSVSVAAALSLLISPPANAALILNAPMSITHSVTVNPIIASDDAGSNTATFMGTASQEASIKSLVDSIWAQAGIDVIWLAPQAINSTEILDGSDGPNGNSPRPTSDLSNDAGGIDHETIGDNAGVTIRGGAINIFFVNIAAGFSLLSANSVAGLAERPGDDISLYVGGNLPGFLGGREAIAGVIAHEIGHNLSLPHIVEVENFMQAGGSPNPGDRINGTQISAAIASGVSNGILIAIPEPSRALLLVFGLGAVNLRRRRA